MDVADLGAALDLQLIQLFRASPPTPQAFDELWSRYRARAQGAIGRDLEVVGALPAGRTYEEVVDAAIARCETALRRTLAQRATAPQSPAFDLGALVDDVAQVALENECRIRSPQPRSGSIRVSNSPASEFPAITENLLEQCAAGDETALVTLYQATAPFFQNVVRIHRRFYDSFKEVPEAGQEIFIHKFVAGLALQKFLDRRPVDIAGFKPYTYVVVRNATEDMNRESDHIHKHEAVLLDAGGSLLLEHGGSKDALVLDHFRRLTYRKGTPSPETHYRRRELYTLVTNLLRDLLEASLSEVLDLLRPEDRPAMVEAAEGVCLRCRKDDEASVIAHMAGFLLSRGGLAEPLAARAEAVLRRAYRERAIIQLKYFDNLKASEIGARLGMSQDNVYQVLHRAMVKIAAALTDTYGILSRDDLVRYYDVRF